MTGIAHHPLTPQPQDWDRVRFDQKCLAILCLVIVCSFMMIFSGCAVVGPDFVPPTSDTPARWSPRLSHGMTADFPDTQTLAEWWTTLNDPILTRLIERAISGNLDLKKAMARIVEARARRGMVIAGKYPDLSASGSATLTRNNGNVDKALNSGFDAGWEIDFFGRIKRSIEASDADLAASRENRQDVLVSLLAEVALNYVTVREYQTRLNIAINSQKIQEETYSLTRWRNDAGLSSQLDVEQAKSNLEETRALVPSLQAGLEQTMNQISLLLGKNPGFLRQELAGPSPIPVPPIQLAIGVPADALRRLPGIRMAERQLAAQTARVGVATADLYPSFQLTGSIGLEFAAESSFPLISKIFRFSPSFSWPLFDAGSIRQNIAVQNALQEQASITYETAVLSALKDVEDAIVAYANEQVRRQSLLEASRAAQRAEELAGSQYASGMIDFQVVLTAQKSLLSLQTQLAQSDAGIASNLIRLYKALGGGWKPLAEKKILSGDRE